MPIKSFRGRLTSLNPAGGFGTKDITTIKLATNNGSTGYRIVKFRLMAPDASENVEGVVKIYKIPQTSIDGNIDFADNTLLAVGVISQSATDQTNPNDQEIYFDNEVFNQDIYIYNLGADYDANVNYYIELEQVKLDLNENTVATLKDIRNITG
tara:strand:- start:25 stop:486 length:462 start_codon:yes stop_codon:yes gene_type:complete